MYVSGNHLGNVLTVVSDKKIPVDNNSDNVVDYFVADVVSSMDYYAFGSIMPGRNFNSNSARYQFNGKETDQETGTQDYGMRIYNPSLGRFLSVDPITADYPELTPYQFASNTPIAAIDIDGLEAAVWTVPRDENGKAYDNYNFDEVRRGYNETLGKFVKGTLGLTDVNDVTVLVTTTTRSGNGINIDGSKATAVDKGFALGGLFLPVVSGSAVKKVLKFGFEAFQQSFKVLNWSEKVFSAFKGAVQGSLRNSLIKAGLNLTGKEAHHLIPKELLLNNKVVQDAVDGGFDFNGVINGMVVKANHGPHKAYTDQIVEKIGEWQKANPDYSPADAKAFLVDLAGDARKAVGETIKQGKKVDEAVIK